MLFDTTFLIDQQREFRRGKAGPARQFFAHHAQVCPQTSVVCAAEFAEGYEANHQSLFEQVMEPFEVLPLNAGIAWRAGQLRRLLRETGASIGDHDTLIAATALHHAIPLVTRNAKHFASVPGLLVLSY